MEKPRKVLKIGNGYYISIPVSFVKKNQLKHGDKLAVKTGRAKIEFKKIPQEQAQVG